MKIIKALAVAISAAFFVAPTFAQNVGTVTNHAVPVGKGIGKQGLTSVGPCTAAYTLIFAGASADPACGQVDMAAGTTGTLAIGNGGTGTTTYLSALQAWGLQVPNLVHKAVPVGADKIGFYDVAGGAYKYSTLTELLGSITSGVSSIAGNTGAFTLNSTSGITNSTNDIILSQASSSQFGAVKVDNATVFAASGVISAKASQLPGIATNTAANAGNLGEYISSTVLLAGAQALVNTTDRDVTTVSLTAGDWLCNGNAWSNNAGTITVWDTWINTAANTQPTRPGGGAIARWFGSTTTNIGISTGQLHLLLSGTTTVSLGANSTFSGGSVSAYGFIGCARIR